MSWISFGQIGHKITFDAFPRMKSMPNPPPGFQFAPDGKLLKSPVKQQMKPKPPIGFDWGADGKLHKLPVKQALKPKPPIGFAWGADNKLHKTGFSSKPKPAIGGGLNPYIPPDKFGGFGLGIHQTPVKTGNPNIDAMMQQMLSSLGGSLPQLKNKFKAMSGMMQQVIDTNPKGLGFTMKSKPKPPPGFAWMADGKLIKIGAAIKQKPKPPMGFQWGADGKLHKLQAQSKSKPKPPPGFAWAADGKLHKIGSSMKQKPKPPTGYQWGADGKLHKLAGKVKSQPKPPPGWSYGPDGKLHAVRQDLRPKNKPQPATGIAWGFGPSFGFGQPQKDKRKF